MLGGIFETGGIDQRRAPQDRFEFVGFNEECDLPREAGIGHGTWIIPQPGTRYAPTAEWRTLCIDLLVSCSHFHPWLCALCQTPRMPRVRRACGLNPWTAITMV
jgi:hypothetical protein